MLDEQRLYEYGGLLAAGYGLYQARKIHDTELEKAKQRHKESIELARKQHETDMKTVKQTYLLELFNSLEQHFQQLNADLIASSRESERDMFDQRNQSFQTIILASSVMFSALSSLIVQGNLPRNSGQFLLVAYSLTCALSFSFLFLSIVFCIELVIRTSSFMYKRGKSHTKSLRKAINDTKGMMRDLRGEGRSYDNLANLDVLSDSSRAAEANKTAGIFTKGAEGAPSAGAGLQSSHTCSLNALNEAGNNNIKNIRRAISRMNPNEIEEEFERHESEIRGYLKKREVLNDSAAITSYRDEVTGHKRPFKHFWEESCATWWGLAILLFYGGSLNMLLALMIYMWAQFFLRLHSMVAAIIGVALLGLILVVGIATVIVMRHVDRLTHRQDNLELLNMSLGAQQDESMRVDLSGSTDHLALSSSDRLSNRANSLNGSPRASSGPTSPLPPPPPRTPLSSFIGRSSARSGDGSDAAIGGSNRSANPPVGREHTDSTATMTSSQSQSGGSTRPHAHAPGARATGPARSSRAGPAAQGTPSTGGLTMQNLPSRLETHMEDIEAGSQRTDSSVNSMLSLPPRMTPGDNIFQEEPSPRRRFLSSFGRSSSAQGSQQKTPSLYVTALRNSSNATPSQLLANQSSQQGTPNAAAPPNTPATSSHAHSFRFPSTFSTGARATPASNRGAGPSSSQYTPGARQSNPVAESDSSSNLSNMSGSGGGITF